MVKIATAGKFRCNKADRKKRSKKEIKKAALVLTLPLTIPLKNKITGNRTRATEPIKGIKATAKTKAATKNKSFRKGILRKDVLNLSKDDNLLTTKFYITTFLL
ncbi:MAG: hypothetical protein STSR0002_10550 [Smithella sp.]|jgi:hypothetical protein